MPHRTASLEPRIRASVLLALQDYLEEAQLEAGPLFAEFGVSNVMVRQPLEFVQLSVVGELLEHISEIAKDDIVGLRLGSMMEPGKSGLLGHLALTAPTARDALSVLAGYVNVFITNIECGYEENHKSGLSTAYWRYPNSIAARRQLNMFTAAAVIQRLRDAMKSDWQPIRVDLEHRKPKGCTTCRGKGCGECSGTIRRILGKRVNFDQPMNRIIHTTSALNQPMPTSNKMAFLLHLDHARKALEEVTVCGELADLARAEIVAKLRKHDCSLQSVADALDMSPRTLQTKLDQSGTNFEKLIAEVREETASRLLRETDMALSDIAYELGYADPSVFSRAARRWFNESPRGFRARHRR